ncbi:MAG: hypothetical protein K0U64_00345 [Actinomycetia bacterium]|nr:hypothetical protein [Actinomycetes bacterium]
MGILLVALLIMLLLIGFMNLLRVLGWIVVGVGLLFLWPVLIIIRNRRDTTADQHDQQIYNSALAAWESEHGDDYRAWQAGKFYR